LFCSSPFLQSCNHSTFIFIFCTSLYLTIHHIKFRYFTCKVFFNCASICCLNLAA
jgi:hypothetical protein